ncbi:MAG TPA: FtsX-like permease family protein [Jatrophihabitantaceae bacterium]
MRIGRGGVTGAAMQHRSGQAVALFVLSLLGIAACAFGPLYERAVEGAQLKTTLASTPILSRGLVGRTTPAARTADMFASAANIRHFYSPPVASDRLAVTYARHDTKLAGDIVSRTDQCRHLPVTDGRCPASAFEVVASNSSAKALGLRVGNQILVTATPSAGATSAAGGGHGLSPVHFRVKIVGLYGSYNAHDEYWFDHGYFTKAGVQLVQVGLDSYYVPDALLAGEGFGAAVPASLPVSTRLEASLKVNRVGLDDMSALRAGLAALSEPTADAGAVQVTSNLSGAFDQVESGRRAARSVIPAFAGELALLLLVVIGIVVVAGADQRRPEFALARLRGSSTARTARRFCAELGVPVLLGVIPGLLVAWLSCEAASRWWLPGVVHPELRGPVLAAAGAGVAVELAIIAVVARATARRPVHELIRRVPVRAPGRGAKVAEAGLAAAAIAGTVVVLSGDRHNAVAVITPGLIALLAGMLLSHLLAFFARVAGRRALWRGRLAAGMAGLRITRRPAVRRIVILLCVASALAVAAADEWRVSARNRSVRANAEAGASVTLAVRAPSVKALQDAVAAADPSGRYATPVVIQQPPDGQAVVAVQPASFARIAEWGWPRDRLTPAMTDALAPARPEPITLTGTSVQLRLANESLTRRRLSAAGSPAPVSLRLRLRRASGGAVDVRLGPLPSGSHRSVVLSAPVPCADGCRLSQLTVSRATADSDGVRLGATITGLYAGTAGALRPVRLGAAGEWAEATPETSALDGSAETISLGDAGGGLGLSFFNSGAPAALQHLDVPIALPAITTGDVAYDLDAHGDLSANNIDATPTAFHPIGHLAFVPGNVGPAVLVNLDLAAAVAAPTLADSDTAVWLGADDPARERSLVATLHQHGVSVVSRDDAVRHRAALAATAPAWAMQAALIAALLAVLIAALLIVISATMSRRERAADASALGLVGIGRATLRRATLLEHLVAVVAGVFVGSAVGVVGAELALPATPIFLARLDVPGIVRAAAWGSILLAAIYTLAALVVASVATSLALTRRIAPLADSEQ